MVYPAADSGSVFALNITRMRRLPLRRNVIVHCTRRLALPCVICFVRRSHSFIHSHQMDPATTGARNSVDAPSTQAHDVDVTSNQAIIDHSRNKRNHRGWRRIVLNFTPSWFSVNMGTGIVSILLYNLPYNARWIYWLSVIIFALNVVLFVLFLFISILRYTLFPGVWSCMINHPVQSLFVGKSSGRKNACHTTCPVD